MEKRKSPYSHTEEYHEEVHNRRRTLLEIYLDSNDRSLRRRGLTIELQERGYAATIATTSADLVWFRKIGMELTGFDNVKK